MRKRSRLMTLIINILLFPVFGVLMAHELEVRYSSKVDKVIRKTLVTVDDGAVPIFNTRYEGDPKAGSVKVPYRVDMVTAAYSKTTGTPLTYGSTAYLTITIGNDEAVNELIDGYEAAAVPDNMVADRLLSAGYAGAKTLDTDAITVLEAEGTTAANTTQSTATTIYDNVVAARTAMSTADIPTKMRWMLASPDTIGLLLKSDDFIKASDLGQEIINAGIFGQIAGFYVKESNNMDANTEFICGHADWCSRVKEWTVAPKVKDLADGVHIGSSAVQGRWVFEHTVTQATAVYIKVYV